MAYQKLGRIAMWETPDKQFLFNGNFQIKVDELRALLDSDNVFKDYQGDDAVKLDFAIFQNERRSSDRAPHFQGNASYKVD